jgi:hypothetical protein
MTRSEWQILAARCEAATGPDERLAAEIMQATFAPGGFVEQSRINGAWCVYDAPNRLARMPHRREGWLITESLDAIVAMIERELPGWWWSCGSCHLTGDGDVGALNPRRLKTHAILAPDYNDPQAKGLPEIEGAAEFDEGFCTSLDGRGKHMAALALCSSFCRAKAALAEDAGHE